ncbi:cysteine desulfurase family protein [Dyadobacter sediminis]|uniref:Cysteine desulfurase n=1 Tax=Dyadobacter sediminis TaxID=1493691 RepID=A0A5R9K8U2_9BACT|nr:cysteine desulfurase family protein [Dyadobacter sediminis]TLU90494.1 cysteine desulfurase [Dyadobacter sediminis]GGC08168.1 cysteine desulfurase [Dyadobacter sediminis]
MKAYLDNAATTRLDPEVLEVMLPIMTEQYGNPSSIHSQGRAARSAIERARKSIAGILNAAPAEIFFTSGGTEADNTAIRSSIETLGLKHAITSRIEHHAVLHTLEHLHKTGQIQLSYVDINEKGEVDLEHLETLLAANPRSLVSLMHGNNEIGNLLDLDTAGAICEKHNAVFHCDTVQTMGHYKHDLQQLKTNFIVGAAHKFNGPKGVGFLYVRPGIKIVPFVHGGAQERNMRGGTENIYGIVGLAKALEIAYRDMDSHEKHIKGLKARMIEKLRGNIEGVTFNGNSADLDKSLYTVLNVSLPPSEISDMLLFNLDIAGIAVSGGSACSSGTEIGSHVLNELQIDPDRANVRFSFGKYNTEEEIDYAVNTLAALYRKESIAL